MSFSRKKVTETHSDLLVVTWRREGEDERAICGKIRFLTGHPHTSLKANDLAILVPTAMPKLF